MIAVVKRWLARKWQDDDQKEILKAYQITFSTMHGQLVLQHLIDKIYCAIYEGKDDIEMAIHNGRRSVIHEILQNIDIAENPVKYQLMMEDTNVT